MFRYNNTAYLNENYIKNVCKLSYDIHRIRLWLKIYEHQKMNDHVGKTEKFKVCAKTFKLKFFVLK